MTPPRGHGTTNWFEAGAHVRNELRRRDAEWLVERMRHPSSRFVPVWRNRNLVGDDAAVTLTTVELSDIEAHVTSTVLLGEHGDIAMFGVELDAGRDEVGAWLGRHGRLADLREVAGHLDRDSAALLAHARAMAFWHRQHRFCGACGHPTEERDGGYMRACTNPDCGKSHFPRTDPAIIVLVEADGRCLLGRSRGWPPGLFSTLAGFVEPGESVEDAVRREVHEESGVRVGEVSYQSSQPWPFPSSLMLGFRATAVDTRVEVDPHELDDARWFTRDELIDGVHAGTLKLPRGVSIARRLLEEWFDEAGTPLASLVGES